MRIARIHFSDSHRVELVVEMPDPDRCTTHGVPHLPAALFRLFPRLACHRCDNDGGHAFPTEAMGTEIPHLLEHLIIEIQAEARPHEVLRGETRWNWRRDPRGTFHVRVEYENEQLALAAIRLAERIVNAVQRDGAAGIDVEGEIRRLRRIARLGEALRREAPGVTRGPLAASRAAAPAGALGGRARPRASRPRPSRRHSPGTA